MKRALAAALACSAACSGGAAFTPGARTLMTVAGAQYFPGDLPKDASGPPVAVFNASNSVIRLGTQGRSFAGDVPEGTQAVALRFDRDPGYWIVPSGLPDPQLPGQLEFSARLSFAARAGVGPAVVEARAIDDRGRFGPPAPVSVRLVDLDTAPEGRLVIALEWDSNADLDLHVVDPAGAEIWARNINSYKGTGGYDPGGPATGGVLDFDSNSMCILDGRRRENVSWKQSPPSGHYTVRVDTWSLCGEPEAYWHLVARLDGKIVGESRGPSLDSDAAQKHGAGAGALALQFDIP